MCYMNCPFERKFGLPEQVGECRYNGKLSSEHNPRAYCYIPEVGIPKREDEDQED